MKRAAELAEAIGTFALVFVGCGAIMVNERTGALGHVGVSIAFGLVIAAMIYAAGHISGAHFNPAVTMAFAATKHFPKERVAGYVLAQCMGAIVAMLALRVTLGDAGSMGVTEPSRFIDLLGLVIVEVVITAMLMFVIASVATDGRAVGIMAGAAIGGTVALASLVAGPLTGASMNPARSLGPALVAIDLDWLPHYLLIPLVGAWLGAQLYQTVRRGSRPLVLRTPEELAPRRPSAASRGATQAFDQEEDA